MNTEWNHGKPINLNIGENDVPFIFNADPHEHTYSILMKMLPREEALGDFVHENDKISSILDENDMVIILYQRHNEKEPRALFCFKYDKHPTGQDFYWAVVTYIKDAYAEDMI